MRFFCRVGFIALLSFGMVGCSQPKAPEGILRVGIGAQPATLDPQLTTGLSERRILSACFEGLVIFSNTDPSGVEPGVAHEWKLSEDGRTYTFHLRPYARWSNAWLVNASDFVWALRRGLSNELAAPYADLANIIEGVKEYRNSPQTAADWDKVGYRALDRTTLEVTLTQPSPVFLRTLTSPFFYPLQGDIVSQYGNPYSRTNHWANKNLVGNGPFVFRENRIYQKLIAQRNFHYWDRAKLLGIEFYPIDNRAAEEIAFLSGSLDVTMSLPLTKVPAYRDDPRLRIDPALQVEMVLLNTQRAPLDNVNVRRALSLGLNRQAMCDELLRAGQSPAWRLTPPGISGGYTPLDYLHEDTTAAQSITDNLSATDRQQLADMYYRFNSSEARKAIAETLQAQWSNTLGITIGLENLEWKTFLQMRNSQNFDMARTGWIADVDDPSDFLNLFVSDNPNNHTGWSNTDYDSAVAARDFAAAEAILMRELPVIPLFFNPNVYLISPRVHGWEASAMDSRPWKRVWVD